LGIKILTIIEKERINVNTLKRYIENIVEQKIVVGMNNTAIETALYEQAF
jgi:hypothetical protein